MPVNAPAVPHPLEFAMRFSRPDLAVLASTLAWATMFASCPARGDVFELANGGRIEGRRVESADDRETYTIETATGRISIARSQVEKVESTSAEEREYAALARRLPDTVDAHWKLSEWCREHKLRRESQQHLARILELDPQHVEARTLLGFKKNDGQWMTRDEVMNSRGLVLYDGRYVTSQHVELLERAKDAKLSQADWSDKFERWRRALVGRRADRAAQALAEVRQVRDPMAAAPLVRLLEREEDPDLKRLWIQVAAEIDQPSCIGALIDLSLYDNDEEIRTMSLDALVDLRRPEIVAPYVRALGHKNNEIVNRAGEAIGQLGNRDAIGPLISALITNHRFQISGGNSGQMGVSFAPDGSSGGMSFGGGGPKFVNKEIRNPAVLGALVQLAGTSFDYDQNAWRAWLAAQARAKTVDVRRDD